VIGDPVEHSLSPLLHNAAFVALGLDWAYGAFAVHQSDVASALAGARALGFVGLSVTMPHKDAIARLADQTTITVERLGAANTVIFEGGVALAASTDGDGLLDDLADAEGFDPRGATCAVIGAGGAARAIILALFEAGAQEILICNRTAARAEAAVELAPGVARRARHDELGEASLVVNATSLGMAPKRAGHDARAWPGSGGEPAIELATALRAGQLVVDLVYRPDETAFLGAARASGARTRNGLGMLVCQAARQVELWTGKEAPRAAMWAAVRT
jgi:shikimate dehydrogenase